MTSPSQYSPALIRRLPAYFRTLIDFYGKNRSRISSEELASAMGITPSQVRADISAIGCQGLSRVDFFVTHADKRIVFNEINTLPGFTSISMYPKLFAASGIPYDQLVDELLRLAQEAC